MSSDLRSELSVLDTVVPKGLCVGCGICSGISPQALTMSVDEFGANLPVIIADQGDKRWRKSSLAVCPFSSEVPNEDILGSRLFGKAPGMRHRTELGFYLECSVGHINDHADRMASSSGGLTTWLIRKLLELRVVDAAICVGPSSRSGELFEYRIVREAGELSTCRQSRYYPIEVSRIIPSVLESSDRYAFVGLPCYCKGMRLAMDWEPRLHDRISYMIGLVCGHLKTRQFAWYLARCAGVPEEQLINVNFRKKVDGRSALDYSFEAVGNGRSVPVVRSVRMTDVFCGPWGYNTFMLDACDWCDDVFSELADITIGDAWIEPYRSDYRGTNLIVFRDPLLRQVFRQGVDNEEISLSAISDAAAVQAQAGGLRHRREGLAYRMSRFGRGKPLPLVKRVVPDSRALPWFHRRVQNLRQKLKVQSREAFLAQQQTGSGVDHFRQAMRPLVTRYDRLYWWRAQWLRLIRVARKRLGKYGAKHLR